DAGTAAAVRDAEGLVQVQVRDVRAPLAGFGDADQRGHVGAVGVDLAAVAVDDPADLDHILLEHAVRGGVGHHQRREVGGILPGFGAQVGDIDVAIVVAFDDDDLHAGHLRTGRVGTVRRGRDEADVAVAFTA